MRCTKRRKRCAISPERIRVNDSERVPPFGEPPLAIDAVCRRRGSPDLGIAEQSGANAVLGLARGFHEVSHPLFSASGRGQSFWTARGTGDYVTRPVVCNRASEPAL